jgi:tRNA(Ile)-lysidine synthase
MPATAPPPDLADALARALGARRRLVLAVSGGLDSMALLHAVAAWRPPGAEPLVATYDHGTGPAARDAARLVVREARRLGLPVVAGRARRPARDEAGWRRARWRFLARVAARHGGPVVTAHTRDDQVETVAMRILRGAGPRGLAALAAPSPVLRPWLGVSRARLAAWVERAGLAHVEDPSNRSLRHLRNRLRLELLPALRAVRPALDAELLDLAERAARWRREVEVVVDRLGVERAAAGAVYVARDALAGYSPAELAVLWPAVAARAGVRLDRRGTCRLAAFTSSAGRVARLPLAGGAEVLALPARWLVRSSAAAAWPAMPLGAVARHGGWRLGRVAGTAGAGAGRDLWRAALPDGVPLVVRSWEPGDRIQRAGAKAARRVKRCFADAGVPGPLRVGWPVVLAAGEIVWIPGVCRSDAATARPGRPAVHYVCDRSPC